MPNLDAFLNAHGARPWAWGETDCSLVLADWAVANGHADPGAEWRGLYGDEDGWRRIVHARGGLHPLVSDVCARHGFPAVAVPARGIVAVIGARHNVEKQYSAIHDGSRWLVRMPDGFVQFVARPLGMWSVT